MVPPPHPPAPSASAEQVRRRLLSGRAVVAGVMSGTSADGIDVALVRPVPGPGEPRPELLAFETRPFPEELRGWVRRVLDGETTVNEGPGGVLPGAGELKGEGIVPDLERAVMDRYPSRMAGLIKAGLAMERRALVLLPLDFCWRFESDALELRFSLGRGQFATSVLREIVGAANDDVSMEPQRFDSAGGAPVLR